MWRSTDEPLTVDSAPRDEVTTWCGQSDSSAWHTDRGCPALARLRPVGAHQPVVSRISRAEYVGFDDKRAPCKLCTPQVLLRLAWAWSKIPEDRCYVSLLACPRNRHDLLRNCASCARLRDLADRAALPCARAVHGRTLLVTPISPLLGMEISQLYLRLPVADSAVTLTPAALEVGWALAVANGDDRMWISDRGHFVTTLRPNWDLAAVIAEPARQA